MSIAKIMYHIAYMDMRPTFEDEPGDYMKLEGPPPQVSGCGLVNVGQCWSCFGRVDPTTILHCPDPAPRAQLVPNHHSKQTRAHVRAHASILLPSSLRRACRTCARICGPQSRWTGLTFRRRASALPSMSNPTFWMSVPSSLASTRLRATADRATQDRRRGGPASDPPG